MMFSKGNCKTRGYQATEFKSSICCVCIKKSGTVPPATKNRVDVTTLIHRTQNVPQTYSGLLPSYIMKCKVSLTTKG